MAKRTKAADKLILHPSQANATGDHGSDDDPEIVIEAKAPYFRSLERPGTCRTSTKTFWQFQKEGKKIFGLFDVKLEGTTYPYTMANPIGDGSHSQGKHYHFTDLYKATPCRMGLCLPGFCFPLPPGHEQGTTNTTMHKSYLKQDREPGWMYHCEEGWCYPWLTGTPHQPGQPIEHLCCCGCKATKMLTRCEDGHCYPFIGSSVESKKPHKSEKYYYAVNPSPNTPNIDPPVKDSNYHHCPRPGGPYTPGTYTKSPTPNKPKPNIDPSVQDGNYHPCPLPGFNQYPGNGTYYPPPPVPGVPHMPGAPPANPLLFNPNIGPCLNCPPLQVLGTPFPPETYPATNPPSPTQTYIIHPSILPLSQSLESLIYRRHMSLEPIDSLVLRYHQLGRAMAKDDNTTLLDDSTNHSRLAETNSRILCLVDHVFSGGLIVTNYSLWYGMV